jgi:hypothetical protein
MYLGSAGLPGDESLLSLFSAKSADDVERTIDLAEVAWTESFPCSGAQERTLLM